MRAAPRQTPIPLKHECSTESLSYCKYQLTLKTGATGLGPAMHFIAERHCFVSCDGADVKCRPNSMSNVFSVIPDKHFDGVD